MMPLNDISADLDEAPSASTSLSSSRLRSSTTLALIMAILGSSVLPIGYAFSITGVTLGIVISLVVALCNMYTCHLVLDAALATKTSTFEELAAAIGGYNFMRFSQVANIILLVGNLTGDFCLLADLGSKSLQASLGDSAPSILVGNHGRGIMVLLIIAVIIPLSLVRKMQGLERVSSAGNVIVMLLCVVLTYDAISADFIGIRSGEVPMWKVNASPAAMADAFALLGFSFYLVPLVVPMLLEVPSGREGVKILADAVSIVIPIVALGTFSYIGVMASAAFGRHTQGDIMMNELLPNQQLSVLFALVMLVYLASCIVPIIMSLRTYLDAVFVGSRAPFERRRFYLLTAGIIAVPFAIAFHNPSMSERAYALTGATGVCIVCYIIPVVAHIRLLFTGGYKEATAFFDSGELSAEHHALLQPLRTNVPELASSQAPHPSRACISYYFFQLLIPVTVLIIGCGLSLLSLYNTFVINPE